jgi:hypothetical protein
MYDDDNDSVGWIDISNLSAKVPLINNTIFVKILRIPDDQHNKLFNRQKLKAIGMFDSQHLHSSNSVGSLPKPSTVATPKTDPRPTHNNNIIDS